MLGELAHSRKCLALGVPVGYLELRRLLVVANGILGGQVCMRLPAPATDVLATLYTTVVALCTGVASTCVTRVSRDHLAAYVTHVS